MLLQTTTRLGAYAPSIARGGLVTAAILATALFGAACSGGGSGGGGGTSATSGTSTSAATSTQPTGFTGVDTTAPTFAADAASGKNTFQTIDASGFVTLSGTANDTESGVATVLVNGTFARLTGTANDVQWEADLPARAGVNLVEIEVRDHQGNQVDGWWSVYAAERYLDPADAIADAAVVSITAAGFTAFETLVNGFLQQNNALALAMLNQTLNLPLTASLGSGISATVSSVSFGAATLSMVPTGQGLALGVSIPQFDFDADIAGVGQIQATADRIDVAGTVEITVQNGQYQVTIHNPQVAVVNLQVPALSSLPATTQAIVQLVIQNIGTVAAQAVTTTVAPAIQRALNSFTPSYSQDVLGVTFTATAQPTAITYSTAGIDVTVAANITHNAAGQSAPGSLGYTSQSGPTFSGAQHVGAALSSELVNRALYTAWDAGLMSYTIDQQLLSQLGLNLGSQISNVLQIVALLFPQIIFSGLTPQDIALEVAFDLPPSIGLDSQTPNVRAAFGTLHVSIVLDYGNGITQRALSLELAGELSADVSTTAQAIDIAIVNPTSFQFAISAGGNPLGMNVASINSFLNLGLSQAISLLGNLIPSIPIPAIPAFQGTQVTIDTLDTAISPRFVVVEATVR